MRFTGKLRKIGSSSLMVTIPIEIVEKLKLKDGQIHEFDLFDEWINRKRVRTND